MKQKYNQQGTQTSSLPLLASICLILMLGFGTNLKAQLAMTKSNFTGTYTPITIATGATASTASVSSSDDGTQASIPLGFTFNYLGTNYTSVAACVNGWVSFNSATTSGSFTNSEMYTTSGPNNAVFPWFDDLTMGVNSVTGTAPSMLYQTQGTAGSQTFTMQWTNFCAYRTTGGSSINFQVILYEGTNVIEFRYGNKIQGTLLTTESASIGIENNTGGPGNYLDAMTGSGRCGHYYLAENQWPTTSFRFTPGAPTPLAAGTYNVGVGQTYTSLTEAVADVNQRGVAGAVVLNLTDALYDTSAAGGNNMFPIIFGPIAGTSAANTVTVSKSGAQASIRWGGNISGSTAGEMVNGTTTTFNLSNVEPIIAFVGADYVDLNNVEVRGDVGFKNSDLAIGVYNNTATDGSTFNTIENFSTIMNRANTGTKGVIFNVPVTPTNATGANSNNTLRNFSISNSFVGILMTGNASFPDVGNVIGNSVCTNYNTIGNPAQANDIGNGGSATFGIRATSQSGISIYNNSIRNVTASAAQVDGIFLDLFQGTSSIYNNKVRTLKNASTSSTTAVTGIRVSQATTGTHVARIYNNSVSEILSSYTGAATTTRTLKGIFVNSAGGGSTSQSYQIHNNSVSIDGTGSPNLSNTCFEIGGTAPIYVMSNNIFANFTPAQTSTAKHMGLFSTSATTFGPAGTTSNNNDIFIANDQGTTGFAGLGSTTTYTSIANWTAAMTTPGGLETASIATNPNYVSTNTDLHVTNLSLNNAGQALQAFVTTDLECAARTDNDLGALNIDACTGTPTAGSISGVAAVCSGQGTTLTLNGASTTAGVSYQWASSTTSGGPYTNMGTGGTQATGALSATTYYVVTVTCTSSGLSATTAEKTVLVNMSPTVTSSVPTALYCSPGTGIAITASGATTYTWTPSAGLSATSGANVTATPTATTTYTVTGTDGNGCTGTATSAITSGTVPTIISTTATPPAVCSGANSQLLVVNGNTVNNYVFSSSTGATLNPMVGATTVIGTGDDDTPTGAPAGIGFSFNYNGTNYTQYSVSPDGWILLGGATATNEFTNAVTSTANVPRIYPYWDDVATGTTGNVQVLLTGTAPNRIFIVQWFVTVPRNTGGAANSTFQAWLYEANGRIEFRYGTMGAGAMSSSVGLTQSATVFNSATISSNTSSTVTANDNNAGQPASGTMYTYAPGSTGLNFVWSPATFLSSTTIANPVATAVTASNTYTVTISNASTCSNTGTVALSAGAALSSAASVTPSNTVCVNSNITLNATPTGGGAPYTYAWSGPNSFTSTSQNPAITGVTMAAAGTYSVTITDNCGANSTAMVTLTINALPTVAVTPTTGAVCNPGGTAVALAASGATTYTWSPSAGLSATSGANVNALPTGTTTYTVTGTDGNGCSSTATAAVGVGPAPVLSSVTATPNAVCNGGNSVLNAAVSFPSSTYCASTHANGCSGDNISNVTLGSINNTTGTTCGGTSHYTDFVPSATTTTTLTPAGGTYTVSVTFGTDPNQYFGAWIDYDQDGVFASSEFLGASANGGASGTIGVTFTVPALAYNGTTKLRVVGGNDSPVTATQACGASSSTFGETQDYTVTITGGVTPFTYAWSPSTYLSSTTVSNPSATAIMSSINYTATVTSGIGCVVTGTVGITAGTALTSAANASPANTVCVGTNTTLHAVPTGGGGPYTFAWTGPNGFTSTAQDTTLNAITLAQAGTYSVTITDNCGANSMASFALVVNTNPVVSVDVPAASICLPGGSAVAVTASGATTYAWLPASGLSATTGASVTANPGATTTYTVTGTDGNGCTGTATSVISVGANPSFVSVTATPSTVCTGGSTQLQAAATISAPVNISEVTLLRGGTGAGVYPAFVVGQDLVELSNNLSTTINISGYTLSAFANNSATASHTITFPVGTTIPAGGVVVVHIGTGTNDVANRYYNTGGATDSYFSSSQMGVVLYNGATVVDAVGMGAGIGYTFNAATGVTALDFSGYAPNIGGNAGVIRTATIDNNTGADWVASTGALPQTIGVFNMVYSAPGSVNYSWTPAGGLNNANIANPVASSIIASTVYSVTATSSIGCTNTTGTVSVTVSPLSGAGIAAAPTTPICVGASVALTSTPIGGGPYTYSWMPGGVTTSNNTVSPSSTTVYTLTVSNSCGESVVDSFTVNVNQLPTVTATAPGTLYCNPGPAVAITAAGASTYTWTPSAGLDVTNTATPNATPTVTTTYTVTGTDVNGCVNTGTIAITSARTPTVTATATPSTPVCAGTPVQLSSTAVIPMTYVQSVTGFNPESCAANAGPTGDDQMQGPNAIGFSFTYYGVTYTQFGISTNGNIQLGNGSGTTNNPTYSTAFTDVAIPNTATPNNMVALAWDDWLISAGEIKWGVTGTSPNQKLVVCYATTGRGGGFADTLQGQIVLEETTNNVILNTIKKGIQPSNTATQGLEDATGSVASMAVSGRNNQAWTVNNETRIFTPYLGTYTYNWTPAADLDTATIATPIARLQTSTTFTFTATEASGCSANATVSVTVNPLPVVALGVDTAVCSVGTPITLDATNAGSTYAWNTAETTQTISVDTTGSYNVSVTDANGCVGADTISVTVNTSPVVNLGIDTVRCGGSVTLDAGNMGSTYAWSDATSGQTTTVSTTGSYDVVVTTPQGCAGYDTVMVTINTIPTVNIGNDTLFCGSNMALDAGNVGSSYFWNTTEVTQTINITTTGQYFVEVTTPQNCSSRDTINVTIAPAITVSLGNDSAVCSSTSVILDAQNAGSTYLWNDNTNSSTLIVTTPGVYSVLVTSPAGCTAQDTVTFTDNSPVVDLTLPFSITCVTSSVNALSGGSPVGGFYSGTGVTGTNFNAVTAGVGTYLITYSYTDGTTGCFATDTQSVVVDPCVGIKELSTVASIVIAPNPTTGNFSINMPSRENVLKAEMYTVEGQLISSETYKGREVYEVNITNLANAVYYLRLTVDGETNVVKIVKQQ